MFYFIPSPENYDQEEELGDLKKDSPLIPSFPMQDVDCDYFVGADAHGKVRSAVAVELNVDPDDLIERAVKLYPGMPRKLIEDYIVYSCVAACKADKEHKHQCMVQGTRAIVRALDEDHSELVLWENIDPKNYL
jgi:hypothetical protein